MAGPSSSNTVLIVAVSIISALVFCLILLITLLVIRWRKQTKRRNLDNRFAASIGNDKPVNTLDMRRNMSSYRPIPVHIRSTYQPSPSLVHTSATHQVHTTPTYQPIPPPVHINQHPNRAANTIYTEPRIYTVSKRTSSHYATVSRNSEDLDDYPYAVVNKPTVYRAERVSRVDSMRSSAGVDLGAQYQKAQWILREEAATSSHMA